MGDLGPASPTPARDFRTAKSCAAPRSSFIFGKAMPVRRTTRLRRPNRHSWILEPLEEDPVFMTRAMFGCLAAYFDGRLVLVLADKQEPWRGVLVPTERDAHSDLVATIPALRPHEVLPKWLYLAESTPEFEGDCARLVERIRHRDPRIGVLPAPRRAAKNGRSRTRKKPPR